MGEVVGYGLSEHWSATLLLWGMTIQKYLQNDVFWRVFCPIPK